MPIDARCPFCVLPLSLDNDQQAVCSNGHAFDPVGLSLATNMAAARALWLAVSAVEDDAAGLRWRASRPGVARETAEVLRAEADDAVAAAATLRVLAGAAQRRLEELPLAAGVLREATG